MPPALDLARRYATVLAALRAVHDFDDWLGEHWHERCPRPTTPPAAHTPVGRAGVIAWYELAETVIGIVPGESGCFRFGRAESMPVFAFSGEPVVAPFATDVVISAAMREELPPPGS